MKMIFPERNNALLKNKERSPYRLWGFFCLAIILLQLPVGNHVKPVESDAFCIRQKGEEILMSPGLLEV